MDGWRGGAVGSVSGGWMDGWSAGRMLGVCRVDGWMSGGLNGWLD